MGIERATMALDPQRREKIIDHLARRAARMRITAPAILFLEMHRPLAYVGAQMLWAAQPFLNVWLEHADIRDLALLLEDPASVEALIHRLESLPTDQAPLAQSQ
jgi:hypothetical protein